MDELTESARNHERLKESMKQKEDKIASLQERLEHFDHSYTLVNVIV